MATSLTVQPRTLSGNRRASGVSADSAAGFENVAVKVVVRHADSFRCVDDSALAAMKPAGLQPVTIAASLEGKNRAAVSAEDNAAVVIEPCGHSVFVQSFPNPRKP